PLPFPPPPPPPPGLGGSRPGNAPKKHFACVQDHGLAPPKRRRRGGGRYVFCATVRQVTLPGRYPAHCPSEFGLSSHLCPFGLRWASPLEACPAVAPRCEGGRSSGSLRRSNYLVRTRNPEPGTGQP